MKFEEIHQSSSSFLIQALGSKNEFLRSNWIRVIFTWVYNHTSQTIQSVFLLHTMVHYSIWLVVPVIKLPPGFLAYSMFLYLVVELLIIYL